MALCTNHIYIYIYTQVSKSCKYHDVDICTDEFESYKLTF